MSLINDALRDLDSRRDVGSIGAEKNFARPMICADEENKTAAKVSYGVFLMLCGIGGALVYDLGEPLRTTIAEPVIAEVTPHVNNAAIEPTALEPNVNNKNVEVQSSSSDSGVLPNDEGHLSTTKVHDALARDVPEVEVLVERARDALVRNRLTLPEEGSAIYFLSRLRSIDASHPEVLAIEVEVKARYEKHISFAIEHNRLVRAQFLVSRGGLVGLSDGTLESFDQKIAQKQEAQRMVASEQSKPQAPVREQWVTQTLESRENVVIGQARSLINQGERSQAIAKVYGFLQEQPDAFLTRVFLFDLYMDQNNIDSAQTLLEGLSKGHTLTPYFQAQLVNVRSGPESAIPLLEGAAADPRISHKRDALLAAMYQKAGRHQDAVGLYATLLSQEADNTRYLLGYAIASDALGKTRDSLSAYRKIQNLGYVNLHVERFVESRIARLSIGDLAGASSW